MPAPTGQVRPRATSEEVERPTGEYQPLAGGPSGELDIEAKVTSQYHPSVSSLVKQLEAPEVAPEPEEHPDLAALRLMIPSVQGHIADLKAHDSPEDPRRPRLLELARATAAEASALLARVPASEELAPRRDELSHAQLILERLIDSYAAKAKTEAKAKAKAKAISAAAARPQAPAAERAVVGDEQQQQRRRNMLLLFAGLLLAGRLALLLPGRAPSQIEQMRAADGVVSVVNHAAGATEAELAEGLPSVMELTLAQTQDGTLRARALAIDPNGDPITLSFKWLENGKELETEPLGLLAARQVMAGASYEVEATAADATHRSTPLRTPALTAERGGKGTIGIAPLSGAKTQKRDDAKGLSQKRSSGHNEIEKTPAETTRTTQTTGTGTAPAPVRPRGAHK